MNKQELFQKAVTGLLSQDGPSRMSDSSACQYFGVDNRRCAFGHLIPDEFVEVVKNNYNTNSAGMVLRNLHSLRQALGIVTGEGDSAEVWLNNLQDVLHDQYRPDKVDWRTWVRASARVFAETYTLDSNFIEAL